MFCISPTELLTIKQWEQIHSIFLQKVFLCHYPPVHVITILKSSQDHLPTQRQANITVRLEPGTTELEFQCCFHSLLSRYSHKLPKLPVATASLSSRWNEKISLPWFNESAGQPTGLLASTMSIILVTT